MGFHLTLGLRQYCEPTLEQIQIPITDLEHPNIPEALKGIEGIEAANQILIKKNVVGILIGGLAIALWDGEDEDQLKKHKDIDILVPNPKFKPKYQFEKGIDWWYQDKKLNKSVYKNGFDVILKFFVEIHEELEPGLYFPSREFLISMRAQETAASNPNQIIDDIRDQLEIEIGYSFSEHLLSMDVITDDKTKKILNITSLPSIESINTHNELLEQKWKEDEMKLKINMHKRTLPEILEILKEFNKESIMDEKDTPEIIRLKKQYNENIDFSNLNFIQPDNKINLSNYSTSNEYCINTEYICKNIKILEKEILEEIYKLELTDIKKNTIKKIFKELIQDIQDSYDNLTYHTNQELENLFLYLTVEDIISKKARELAYIKHKTIKDKLKIDDIKDIKVNGFPKKKLDEYLAHYILNKTK